MKEDRQLEETFSARLNEAIALSGKNITQICRESRISRNGLWRCRKGQPPVLPNLLALCRCLKVSADWLCGLKDGAKVHHD